MYFGFVFGVLGFAFVFIGVHVHGKKNTNCDWQRLRTNNKKQNGGFCVWLYWYGIRQLRKRKRPSTPLN
jgi:hypothetical protein